MPVPINANLNEFMLCMEETQQDRMREIQIREDQNSVNYNHYYGSSDENPGRLSRYLFHHMRREVRPVNTPPRIIERLVEVERPVERVVIQTKALPLPKDIGDILLANARKGQECCPIAATPFAECETLCVSSCFHIFEKASLSRWQEDHTTCPVCRCKIENVVYETRVDAATVSEV